MKLMIPIGHIAMAVGMLHLLVGCGRSVMLQAEFDDATVNEPPRTTLPGPPPDDSLSYDPFSSLSASPVVVVEAGDTPPAISLRHVRGSSYPYVAFVAGRGPSTIADFLITWEGVFAFPTDNPLQIALSDGHVYSGVALTLRDGAFILQSDDEQEEIGTYEVGQRHTVLLAIDIEADTYTLTIQRDGASNIQLRDKPLLHPSFGIARNVVLAFRWLGSPPGGIYNIDNVFIYAGGVELRRP